MNIRCFITSSAFVLCSFTALMIEGSSIPMWEFLSRDEKMSHLYRVFSKQVAKYCADSSMPDCNKNLLVSGLRNLANMNEDYLDKMDPYQRGAKEMIWHAMINNNDFYSMLDRDGGSYYSTNADRSATSFGSDQNGLAEESSAPISDYVRPAGHSGPYLVGPMVIRVLPDGRPVPGDSKLPLPRDEDVDDIKYSKIPSIADIESNSRSFFYGKSSSSSSSSSSTANYNTGSTKITRKPLFSVGQKKPTVIITNRRSSSSPYQQYNNPIFNDRRNTYVDAAGDDIDSYVSRTVHYY